MSNETTSPPPVMRWAIRILAVTVVVLGIAYALRMQRGPSGGGPAQDGPSFLNASPDVAYIGTDRCAACHEDRHASYLETTHSRSMSVVDPAKEPIPANFHHKPSDMHYRMYVDEKSGSMRVEESLEFGGTSPYVLADHAMKYLIGSGSHSRSYLTEIDGFLYEAPVTYYSKKGLWGISPGYDRTLHLGFARPTGPLCLSCHVGNIERIDGTINKVKFHESAIGCERCHGPGELHAALHSGDGKPEGEHDLTIVDPKLMSRQQKLDACAQCHMDSTLTVENPGKSADDWRPGMRWTDVMVTYRPKQMWGGMTVLGHVDQMRQSKCFQKSEMTCNTCHDPHRKPPADPAARAVHFNGKCLTCHEHCGRQPDTGPGIVPPEGDNCVKCHMPEGDTDIVHIAFHHHRIGIHGLEWSPEGDGPPPGGYPELEPLGDVSHLPAAVRERNLGMAYLKFAASQRWPQKIFFAMRDGALKHLEQAHADGQRDAGVEAELARLLYDDRKAKRAEHHARAALERAGTEGGLSPKRRADVLLVLGTLLLRQNRVDEAKPFLEELAAMRRDFNDTFELMEIARRENNPEAVAALARRALRILPNNPDVHYQAATAFAAIGDNLSADLHRAVGQHIQRQQSRGVRFLENGGDMAPK